MKKYMALIELDENRTTCLNCPILNADDNCVLQPDNQGAESWDELLAKCPLVEVQDTSRP